MRQKEKDKIIRCFDYLDSLEYGDSQFMEFMMELVDDEEINGQLDLCDSDKERLEHIHSTLNIY